MRITWVCLRMEETTTDINQGCTIFIASPERCVPMVARGVFSTQGPESMQMQHRETDRRQFRETETKILQTGFQPFTEGLG